MGRMGNWQKWPIDDGRREEVLDLVDAGLGSRSWPGKTRDQEASGIADLSGCNHQLSPAVGQPIEPTQDWGAGAGC
jgi:hypothetical protein